MRSNGPWARYNSHAQSNGDHPTLVLTKTRWGKERKKMKQRQAKREGHSRGVSARSTERAKARMSDEPVTGAGWDTMASRSSLAAAGFKEEGSSGGCCWWSLSGPRRDCRPWALAGASPVSARRCICSMGRWVSEVLPSWDLGGRTVSSRSRR